jgi:hypothetical protein
MPHFPTFCATFGCHLSLVEKNNFPKTGRTTSGRNEKMTDFTTADFLIALVLSGVAILGVMHSRNQIAKGGF